MQFMRLSQEFSSAHDKLYLYKKNTFINIYIGSFFEKQAENWGRLLSLKCTKFKERKTKFQIFLYWSIANENLRLVAYGHEETSH